MEIYDLIRSRRTVRTFKPDPVPDEVLHKILQAGRMAPSSSDSQPWHFIVINNRETLKTLGGICTQGAFLADAPMAIAFIMDNAPRPDLDAGRAIQQMELVAWSEGLGTCFVGLRQIEQMNQVKELLGIPAEMELITLLPFGYREEGFKTKGATRKPMSDMVHHERFGQKYLAS